jgi:peptide/nickel transport system substrate-binding protein
MSEISRRSALTVLAAALCSGTARAAPVVDAAREPQDLLQDVRGGRLPPMAERVPLEPRVINVAAMGRTPGRYGGTLRLLMGDQKDIRMITLYGYARLLSFDASGQITPDILKAIEVEESRVFTLRLRAGHRWSDGEPFTSADFSYGWEVINDERLSPGGPSPALLADGKPPRFEVLDAATVRFTWDTPNPSFLPALAAAQPLELALPGHYLKQFNKHYAEAETLAALVKKARVKDWGALHDRMARSYRPENPKLPMLAPWRPLTKPPAELFVFERNPFYHRVDETGLQLPYIGTISISIGTSSLIPAKTGAGGADLQARYLRFDNYTFLKAAEERQNYKVRLWENGEGAYVAVIPNLNVADPVWRGVLRDVRVRRALSVGINRRDINQVIFFGLAHEGSNTVIPQSSLYDVAFDKAWAQHDPEMANRLLDEAGLDKRDADGIRLLPDGRRAEITVQTSGDSTEESDVLELVGYDWRKIGVALFVRATQRDVLRRSVIAGQVMMSTWKGLDNALAGPDMEPTELAPATSMQFQWPLWGQYVDTAGREGQKPDMPEAEELIALKHAWRSSTTTDQRREIWRRMLEINADQVFNIGIVNRTKQPVVVSNRLRNVPETGVYSFEPGAYFGVYLPDTFWFDEKAQES